MPVKEDRAKMMQSLKAIVFPYLRSIGFRGSFPHFRRMRETATDVIAFQFSQYGGSFVVEIAHSAPEGLQRKNSFIPARKLTAWHFGPRVRLGSKNDIGDNWFEFGKDMFGKYLRPSWQAIRLPGKYSEISELIVKLLEEYFSKKQASHE